MLVTWLFLSNLCQLNENSYFLILTVDGHVRCQKWIRDDMADSKESKTNSWFQWFIGRPQKPEVTWSFPFVEDRLSILTVRAGVDGFHINVGGRHETSFPYRTVCYSYLWSRSIIWASQLMPAFFILSYLYVLEDENWSCRAQLCN